MKATFHPQAWINDYAVEVDMEGPNEWEVTPSYYDELLVRFHGKMPTGSSYETDELRDDPAAPEWVRNWHGPFYIETEEDDDT